MVLSKQQAQFSLLFKLQTNKYFNKVDFKSTFQQFWHYSHGVTIKEVGNNLFMDIFAKEENMTEVQDRCPWSFDKILTLLKHFNGDLSPGNLTFLMFSFLDLVFYHSYYKYE